MKQLFYDLGPPAFDHPSLWLSRAEPFPVGSDIGWLGTDFHALKGACLHIERTMVEIAVTEGRVSDQELKSIIQGLQPVLPAIRRRILATPWADLCYQRRYPDLVVTVPIGHWYHRRRPPSLLTTMLRASEIPAHLEGLRMDPPSWSGFRLDSLAVFGDPHEPQELEWVYEHVEYPAHSVRVLVWPPGSRNSLVFPPVADQHPCSRRRVRVRGKEIFHAFSDERFGQHEAVWLQGALIFMLLLKPAPWTDIEYFRGLLEGIVAAA